MNVHLSTYSWLGADKAAGHVYFNSNTSKIKVSQNSDLNGVHIGSNGISMFNESGNYGIIINDKGISLTYSGITYTAGSVKSGDTTMIVFK